MSVNGAFSSPTVQLSSSQMSTSSYTTMAQAISVSASSMISPSTPSSTDSGPVGLSPMPDRLISPAPRSLNRELDQLQQMMNQVQSDMEHADFALRRARSSVPEQSAAPLGNAPPVAQAMEELIMMHVQRTLLMECDDDVATLRERYSRLSDRLPGSLLQSPPGGLLPAPRSMDLSTFLGRFKRTLQPSGRRAIAALLVAAVKELHEQSEDQSHTDSYTDPATELQQGSCGPVHGAIQPSRFVLLKPMSDEWRLMVDTALTSQKDQPIKTDALDPALHSLRYQAPELATRQCGTATHAQDMFSLGLVLFEVLTGSPLFCNDSEAAEVYHGLSVPALRRKAGAVFIEFCVRRRLNELDISDKTLRDFLYRALQFTPALRPTAAKLMLHPLLPRV